MTSLAAHQIAVVGPAEGLYYLGYYLPDDSRFFVIQPFFSGDLAQAALNLMHRARDLARFDEVRYGR
jgi:hypothetical protein